MFKTLLVVQDPFEDSQAFLDVHHSQVTIHCSYLAMNSCAETLSFFVDFAP